MATIDVSLVSAASSIVVFMLLFVGGWGVLTRVNPFKEGAGKSFYGILAFLLAVMVIMVPTIMGVFMVLTPWLVFLVFIGFFIMFFALMFGVPEASIKNAFTGQIGFFITAVVIVLLLSLGSVFGPGLLSASSTPGTGSPSDGVNPNEPVMDANGNIVPAGSINADTGGLGTGSAQGGTATGDFGTNLIFTLINPKVLGLIFLFLLGGLTVVMLNRNS